MKNINRRKFLERGGTIITGSAFLQASKLEGKKPLRKLKKKYRAAIIGRTGKGGYGHGLDVVFKGLDNVELVAVADEDPAGLKNAAEKSGALRQYLDYRVMLEKEKPDIVSIGPRLPDCHLEMASASAEVGAHIYMDKPFTSTPEEADKIIETAEKNNIKIGIAHVMRLQADIMLLKKLLSDGFIGDVLEIRAQGKEDSRVGGEDLNVLGVHHHDLMRFFFGDPKWCFASVTKNGRDITPDDVHIGREPYIVAGDTVRAAYAFENNVFGYWDSIKSKGFSGKWTAENPGRWGFDIYGSRGIVSYRPAIGVSVFYSSSLITGNKNLKWDKLPRSDKFKIPDHKTHPILDLIHAIETDSQPQSSAYDGRWTIEMVAAVYESQIKRKRIAFPLINRKNPLESFKI